MTENITGHKRKRDEDDEIELCEKLKTCKKCANELPVSNFNRQKGGKDGLYAQCRQCVAARSVIFRSTLHGFLQYLLRASRGTARRKFALGRLEFECNDLSAAVLKEMWNRQNGCCYYSGIKMAHSPGSNWQCSLERLDESKGYTKNNVAFCCLEFNGLAQWSREKLLTVLNAQFAKHNTKEIRAFRALITAASKPPSRKGIAKQTVQNRMQDSVKEYKCNKCQNWKTIDEFARNTPCRGCRECVAACQLQKDNTMRGRMQNLVYSARSHAKMRGKKNRIEAGVFKLDFTTVLDMLREQHGLCAYSQVKLGFVSGEPWLVSLERRDPVKGYTKENCCLIALEFNSADHIVQYKDGRKGCAGWNQSKVEYLIDHLRSTNWSA
jgi:ferredoxin